MKPTTIITIALVLLGLISGIVILAMWWRNGGAFPVVELTFAAGMIAGGVGTKFIASRGKGSGP